MLAIRALIFGAPFLAGVLLGEWLRSSAAWSLAAGAAGVACLAAGWFSHRRVGYEPSPGQKLPSIHSRVAALLAVGGLGLGVCALGVRAAAWENAELPEFDGSTVRLSGKLVTDPTPGIRSSRFVVRTSRFEKRKVREKVAVTLFGQNGSLELGDRIKLEGRVAKLDLGDRYHQQLRRRGIVARVTASAGSAELVSKSRNPLIAASNFFRGRFAKSADNALDPENAGLLLGLVIGDERGISEDLVEDFRAAGLSHLTAVSGANLAMVLAPLMLVLGLWRVGRRTQVIAGLVVIFLFTIVTRWEPSVLRAAVMAAAALASFLPGRKSNAAYLLGLAFIGLVAIDPMILWSVGFQLSFAATAGILIAAPLMLERFGAGVPLGASVSRKASSRWLKFPANALAVGLSAQAAVLPLIAWHFGRVSVAAIPANFVAFPLVGPATILGLSAGLLSMISPMISVPVLKASGLFVSGLGFTSKAFAGGRFAQISTPNWKSVEMLAAYLVFAALVFRLAGKRRLARWPLLLAVLLIIVATLVPAAGTPAPPGMRATFFDVGQGDAALVESKGGARVLIDGGPDRDYIAVKLARRGFDRIDLVVASHGHADHVTGLDRVFDRFKIGAAVHPGVEVPVIRRLEEGNSLEPVEDGEQMLIGDLSITFLGPSAAEAQEASAAEDSIENSAINDASVVMRIDYAGQCILFSGDIEEPAQQGLIERNHQQIECAILKAPHHGSGALIEDFVTTVDPEWIAVSVGRNDYGHPTRKAMSIFEGSGAEVARTDRMGDIVVGVAPNGTITMEE